MTRRLAGTLALALAALLAAPGCGRAGDEPLQVAAAASLAELAHDLGRGWQERTGRDVVVRLAASSVLARQVEQGAPVDLFLSADPAWVDGLPALDRRAWLTNRLVWIVPADLALPDGARGDPATADGARLAALARAAHTVALGGEGVPVGRYAQAALQALQLTPRRVVRGADARDVLAKVSTGAADAGVVYATDAAVDVGVRVAAVLPAASHPPIRYEAALISERARPLFEALDESWVRALVSLHGFTSAP